MKLITISKTSPLNSFSMQWLLMSFLFLCTPALATGGDAIFIIFVIYPLVFLSIFLIALFWGLPKVRASKKRQEQLKTIMRWLIAFLFFYLFFR